MENKLPQNAKREARGKRWTIIAMVVFAAASLFCTIYQFAQGKTSFGQRGVFFPLFLLIPLLFKLLKIPHCWRLYILTYAFITFAFTYGCVWGAFSEGQIMDKVSHFFSGFMFTILGFCIYYWQLARLKPRPQGINNGWAIAATYALFFSLFIAVCWEVCEFFDFAITGNDSQNHLTTGVFDTMYDLMSCLVASILSAVSFALYRAKRVKLLTGAVLEEFYEKNVGPLE